jgi:hypothetical protein
MSTEPVQLITEHYQKTFELTYETWKERNKLFVYLVLVTGLGLLLVLQVPEANTLLVDGIVKLLGITDKARISQLHKDFPLEIILSIILIIVFYLMQRLYSTSLAVLRNYAYLAALEKEIRQKLALTENSVSFTREGTFYWGHRSFAQTVSKWNYVLVILIVLLPFILLKLLSDFASTSILITVVDAFVAIMTFVYYGAYAFSTATLDASIPQLPNQTEDKVEKPDADKPSETRDNQNIDTTQVTS